MPKKESDPWFAARESGTSYIPVSWQGYAVLVGYVVLLSLASLLIFKSWVWFFGAVVVLSILLFAIVGAKSSQW